MSLIVIIFSFTIQQESTAIVKVDYELTMNAKNSLRHIQTMILIYRKNYIQMIAKFYSIILFLI